MQSADRQGNAPPTPARRSDLRRLIAPVAIVSALLIGCGADADQSDPDARTVGVAECTPSVRFQGTIYRARVSLPDHPATKLGMADDARCQDVGRDARGSYFPPHPERVEVWALEGFPTGDVIGVSRRNGLDLYVAEGVPEPRAATLTDRLTADQATGSGPGRVHHDPAGFRACLAYRHSWNEAGLSLRRSDMRRLIATLSVTAALVLSGCGSEDADPASDDPGQEETGQNETDAGPVVASVTMTRTGGIAGVHDTWKVGPSDAGHGAVFEAARPEALDDVDTGAGKPPCCDFFQYDLIVRYDDGSNETFRMWDGGAADPALNRLVDAVLNTKPAHPDSSAHTH